MAESTVRQYAARAASTDVFGRVMCSVRNHHYVIDGPETNGCPGEEITPAELFLSAVASCGVELVQVIAKADGIPLQSIVVNIDGKMDRSNPVRPDVSLFNAVKLQFRLEGITDSDAKHLVEKFKGR